MKKIRLAVIAISLILISTLAFVGISNAQSFEMTDDANVAADQVVDSALFISGDSMNIAGTVNGDVFCAGQNIDISGEVNGDVFCFVSQTASISGKINGSVRLFGRNTIISGNIENNLTIGSSSLTIEKDGVIGNDVLGFGVNTTIKGMVGRDIATSASTLVVDGIIGRNIAGDYESISVGSNGFISGNLNYTGKNAPDIATGGMIIGTTTQNEPTVSDSNYKSTSRVSSKIMSVIYGLVSIGALAVVLVLLIPNIFEKSAQRTFKSVGITAVVGVVAAIIAPIAIIAALISFIGIPIALFALLIWILMLVISNFFAAYLLGKAIMKKSTKPFLIMLVGISILIIANNIPIINFLTFLVAGVFGLGAVVMYCGDVIKSQRYNK